MYGTFIMFRSCFSPMSSVEKKNTNVEPQKAQMALIEPKEINAFESSVNKEHFCNKANIPKIINSFQQPNIVVVV